MSNAKYNATTLAFPGQDPSGNDHAGLSKREYFAGLAMQGFLSEYDEGPHDIRTLVKMSCDAADALLEALEANNE